MKFYILILNILYFWVLSQIPSQILSSKTIIVKCIRVLDGDTFIGKEINSKRKFRLRLAYIDAPEIDQKSFDGKKIGEESKKELKRILARKIVSIKLLKIGFYGRPIVEVYLDNQNVGSMMVRRGHALLYPFAEFSSILLKGEFLASLKVAKWKRLGMWRTEGFYSPYKHRKNKRKRKKNPSL